MQSAIANDVHPKPRYEEVVLIICVHPRKGNQVHDSCFTESLALTLYTTEFLQQQGENHGLREQVADLSTTFVLSLIYGNFDILHEGPCWCALVGRPRAGGYNEV
jgi:hypothetical protein